MRQISLFLCLILYQHCFAINMNSGGVPYAISNPQGSIDNWQGTQIRKQMSGPDPHVFTLKFLALKKLVFPP